MSFYNNIQDPRVRSILAESLIGDIFESISKTMDDTAKTKISMISKGPYGIEIYKKGSQYDADDNDIPYNVLYVYTSPNMTSKSFHYKTLRRTVSSWHDTVKDTPIGGVITQEISDSGIVTLIEQIKVKLSL